MSREELIDAINKAGGADRWFGPRWAGGYCIQQDPGELADLVLALQGRPIKSYLQVGSAAGGTERFLCEQLGIKSLTVIDNGKHPQFPVWAHQNKSALRNLGVEVEEHIGDSHGEAAERFLAYRGPFDLVGLDGDHSPAGVRMDWALVAPCLRAGSLVWLHDCSPDQTGSQGPWELSEILRRNHRMLLDTHVFGIRLFEIVGEK